VSLGGKTRQAEVGTLARAGVLGERQDKGGGDMAGRRHCPQRT
jgi:hypothetical protein